MKKLFVITIILLGASSAFANVENLIQKKLTGCFITLAVNGEPLLNPNNSKLTSSFTEMSSPLFQTKNGQPIKSLVMLFPTGNNTNPNETHYQIEEIFLDLGSFELLGTNNYLTKLKYNFSDEVLTKAYPEYQIKEVPVVINSNITYTFLGENNGLKDGGFLEIASQTDITLARSGKLLKSSNNVYLLKNISLSHCGKELMADEIPITSQLLK